jgi:hypothetical protein
LGATGTLLSYNLFAYCENNCVGYFDENGNWFYNYVAFGFQIDLTFGALSGGIEFIFTKDNLEFYAFMYGSLSVTIIDCMEKGLVNALKANIKNLFVKPKSFLKFFSQFELSIGVFMIFRHWYRYFDPRMYAGWSAGIACYIPICTGINFKIFGSVSTEYKTLGVGVSMGKGHSFSGTYYIDITSIVEPTLRALAKKIKDIKRLLSYI